MRDTITYEELVDMPFFEGLAAVSLISRGDLTLIVGGRSARRVAIKKMFWYLGITRPGNSLLQ